MSQYSQQLSGRFPDTPWTKIIQSCQTHLPEGGEALNALCQMYWKPVYWFIRKSGSNHEDAEDITQMFFLNLTNSEALKAAEKERGRFRNFLCAAVKKEMINHFRAGQAQKRGGRTAKIIPIEFAEGEASLSAEMSQPETPEGAFEKSFALEFAKNVETKLESEVSVERFEHLRPFLRDTASEETVGELSERLGVNANTVRAALHRMRVRYRALFREAVQSTVAEGEDVEDEMRHIIRLLAA